MDTVRQLVAVQPVLALKHGRIEGDMYLNCPFCWFLDSLGRPRVLAILRGGGSLLVVDASNSFHA